MMNFNSGLIGTNVQGPLGSTLDMARAPGPVMEYQFKSTKPKAQLKELRKVLIPERKKFIFKLGNKFNVRHRCIVCGASHQWEPSDALRPGIVLSKVTKGRPMQGTYCPKHAGMFKQFEMLQDEVLASKHGLEFKKYIPRPKVPVMQRGPMTNLAQKDVASLIGVGWTIAPPQATTQNVEQRYLTLMTEIEGKLKEISQLVGVIENGKE